MGKTKVTLSVDEAILREAKHYLAERDSRLSKIFEDALVGILTSRLMENFAARLGLEVGYVGFERVAKSRPKGSNAARAVREARDAREKALSRQ